MPHSATSRGRGITQGSCGGSRDQIAHGLQVAGSVPYRRNFLAGGSSVRRIAKALQAPLPTVGRVMHKLGLARLQNLEPKRPSCATRGSGLATDPCRHQTAGPIRAGGPSDHRRSMARHLSWRWCRSAGRWAEDHDDWLSRSCRGLVFWAGDQLLSSSLPSPTRRRPTARRNGSSNTPGGVGLWHRLPDIGRAEPLAAPLFADRQCLQMPHGSRWPHPSAAPHATAEG